MGEMHVNINGVQRRVINAYANINGVWRSSSTYVNIDGVYREIDDFSITENKIIGVKIAYISNHNPKYNDLPHLKYNPKIPASLSATGTSKSMDKTPKGVTFQYTNKLEPDQLYDEEDQEGILLYQAHLYALLVNGLVVDITSTKDVIGWESRHPITAIPGTAESWSINKMNNLHIQVYTKLGYVVNGVNTEGWNRILTETNYIGTLDPYNQFDEFVLPPDFIDVLPIEKRSEDFYELAEIGIARDLHTRDRNMVGSHGYFTHQWVKVTINGVDKPFSVDIYD